MPSPVQLFLVLCFLLVVVRSEVSDFSKCNQFFYKGSPPKLQREFPQPPKRICQKYEKRYHFATLYSTSLRIPLFSAYTLADRCKGLQPRRRSDWFIEPQVWLEFKTRYFRINRVWRKVEFVSRQRGELIFVKNCTLFSSEAKSNIPNLNHFASVRSA